MSSSEYDPPWDQVRAIREAAEDLNRTLCWYIERSERRHFPTYDGWERILASLINVDLKLNPHRLTWDDPARTRLESDTWTPEARSAIRWLRCIVDSLIGQNGLAPLASYRTLKESSTAVWVLPEWFTSNAEDALSLRMAVDDLAAELDRSRSNVSDQHHNGATGLADFESEAMVVPRPEDPEAVFEAFSLRADLASRFSQPGNAVEPIRTSEQPDERPNQPFEIPGYNRRGNVNRGSELKRKASSGVVRLKVIAELAGVSERTLRRHIDKENFPIPYHEGGGGKPSLYEWDKARDWIRANYPEQIIPDSHPLEHPKAPTNVTSVDLPQADIGEKSRREAI